VCATREILRKIMEFGYVFFHRNQDFEDLFNLQDINLLTD
jgi:hypothetical protein